MLLNAPKNDLKMEEFPPGVRSYVNDYFRAKIIMLV